MLSASYLCREEDSPQWLKELKSKKRLSQYENESWVNYEVREVFLLFFHCVLKSHTYFDCFTLSSFVFPISLRLPSQINLNDTEALMFDPESRERWIYSCWWIFFFLLFFVLFPSGSIKVHGAFFIWTERTSKEEETSSCFALFISCLNMWELSCTRRDFKWTTFRTRRSWGGWKASWWQLFPVRLGPQCLFNMDVLHHMLEDNPASPLQHTVFSFLT